MSEQKMTIEQLLTKMQEQTGAEPKPMKLLARLLPDAVFEHARSKMFLESQTAIPAKYKLLMNVAVAAALGSETCTLTHARLALRGGCSGKEIAEALLAARFVKASTVFSTALPALEMMVDEK